MTPYSPSPEALKVTDSVYIEPETYGWDIIDLSGGTPKTVLLTNHEAEIIGKFFASLEGKCSDTFSPGAIYCQLQAIKKEINHGV